MSDLQGDIRRANAYVKEHQMKVSPARVSKIIRAAQKREISIEEAFAEFKHFTYADTTGETAVKNLTRKAVA